MGKKSRKPAKQQKQPVPSVQSAVAADEATSTYPSDGPSEEVHDGGVRTSSRALQQKLDLLSDLASRNDRKGFVEQFVPLDLSAADAQGFLQDLTNNSTESETQWQNLVLEMVILSSGAAVKKIEGDQQTSATFFFQHPLYPGCDREVTFECARGSNEWRAAG